MRIHYLQHAAFEGPAAIETWAHSRGHELGRTLLFEGEFPHPGDVDMLVVMGGPMNVYQELEYPWLAEERAYLRRVVADGRTLVLGVCLGAQLVADALGGSVTRGAQPEIGWYPVELTQTGRLTPSFAALPDSFDVLHWHGDTFEVPPEAEQLASSEITENQAFSYDGGRVIGLQFHLEATRESWAALCDACSSELEGEGAWISSAEQMLAPEAPFGRISEWLYAMLDAMVMRRTSD